MKTPIVLVALWAFVATPTVAATVVLSGIPTVRVTSSSESTSRKDLSGAERQEYGVVIIKRGDEYFWASRENKRLVYSAVPPFHYFVSPEGSGYIKVGDPKLLPKLLMEGKTGFLYMEHVHLLFTTITYWGTADRFNP